jgi:hypothetical protein
VHEAAPEVALSSVNGCRRVRPGESVLDAGRGRRGPERHPMACGACCPGVLALDRLSPERSATQSAQGSHQLPGCRCAPASHSSGSAPDGPPVQ